MRWVITLAIVASVGCADKVVYPDDPPSTGDGDGDADGGPLACESDLGTLAGQVMEDYLWSEAEPSPAGGSKVLATPTNTSSSPIEILTDGNGQFSTKLPFGTYSISASRNGCFSEATDLVLDACETETHVLNLIDCVDGGDADADADTDADADADADADDADADADADVDADADADADGDADADADADTDADLDATADICSPPTSIPSMSSR